VKKLKLYPDRPLPDYYPTMYLDGYTPEEIWVAQHNTMLKRFQKMQAEKDLENEIEKRLEQQIELKLEQTVEKALDEIFKNFNK